MGLKSHAFWPMPGVSGTHLQGEQNLDLRSSMDKAAAPALVKAEKQVAITANHLQKAVTVSLQESSQEHAPFST